MNRKIRGIATGLSFAGLVAVSHPAAAGQGWYITLNLPGANVGANYAGIGTQNCWYPNDFASPFSIPPGGVRKYTEEKWAVFSCGLSAYYIQLNFSVATFVNGQLVLRSLGVYLADTESGASVPQGWSSVNCPLTDGRGQTTAIGMSWVDGGGGAIPAGFASCSVTDGTVNATVNLPAPPAP